MYITRLDAHHKLLISLVAALIIFFSVHTKVSLNTSLVITWITYASFMLGLYWSTIFTVHPLEMKKVAKMQDSNRTLIFMFVLAAAVASLFVVVLLLSSTKQLTGVELSLHVFLSVAAVVCSWALVHTIFVFRYAHLYYENAPVKNEGADSKYVEGLEFPEEKEPDYLDFSYFSFVIGMTFQVSDVEISSKRIRRLALMHSLVSFAFNTVIVALSINIISGLITK
ncbi:Uncharacterized membrane protein [Pedobacter westerhofensis]|uniref:Uncharacterized membrane protein n=1 Tax=Pedobacter westerhofensis TaxID=425512 RepID=A0A521FMW4_9SPHI|nr:DUF1345 domain-containing protein [Pedobacter westerhofensis]SMO97479.1 Uncharacterized membrane protein [Pedobacter westerhofensis]